MFYIINFNKQDFFYGLHNGSLYSSWPWGLGGGSRFCSLSCLVILVELVLFSSHCSLSVTVHISSDTTCNLLKPFFYRPIHFSIFSLKESCLHFISISRKRKTTNMVSLLPSFSCELYVTLNDQIRANCKGNGPLYTNCYQYSIWFVLTDAYLTYNTYNMRKKKMKLLSVIQQLPFEIYGNSRSGLHVVA